MSDTGRLEGGRHGLEDGMSGRPRNPRPGVELAMALPEYAANYQASYDLAYNRAFAARDSIIREAARRQEMERDLPHERE